MVRFYLLFTIVFTAVGQTLGGSSPTGNLALGRAGHTATLLPSGKVLIAGGASSSGFTASAEIYDPVTGTFAQTGSLQIPRSGHTATLLPNGNVLILGGSSSSAELYDPSTGTFRPLQGFPQVRHSANLLTNGRVLIAGQSRPQLFDPDTSTFRDAAPYLSLRQNCFVCSPAVSLASGEILLGGFDPAQIYDPVTDRFRFVEGSSTLSTATLLANGTVLFAGRTTFYDGSPYMDPDGLILHSVSELFGLDARFHANPPLSTRRSRHSVTLLADGTALVAGGYGRFCYSVGPQTFCTDLAAGSIAAAEVFDPATRTFNKTGDLWTARREHTATLLNDGRVLIVGGLNERDRQLPDAELYTPTRSTPAPLLHSVSANGQGAVLHEGSARVASPANPAGAGDYLEIYAAGLLDGAVVPPQIVIGGRLAEVTYFGPSGYPGVNQINVRMPAGVAPGTAAMRMNYLGRFSNEVNIAVK